LNTDEENHKEHEGHKDDGHELFPLVVFVPFVVLFVRTTNVDFARDLRGFNIRVFTSPGIYAWEIIRK